MDRSPQHTASRERWAVGGVLRFWVPRACAPRTNSLSSNVATLPLRLEHQRLESPDFSDKLNRLVYQWINIEHVGAPTHDPIGHRLQLCFSHALTGHQRL